VSGDIHDAKWLMCCGLVENATENAIEKAVKCGRRVWYCTKSLECRTAVAIVLGRWLVNVDTNAIADVTKVSMNEVAAWMI